MFLSKRYLWLAALPLLLTGCGGASKDTVWPERPGPKVVVSFAPLYCFAVNVAGDDAVVKNVMGTTGPHHFQPTDTEARLVRRADLFLINGLNLDNEVAGRIQKNSGNKNLKLIDLGSRLPKDRLREGVCKHDHHHEGDHDHGNDPHVWLSPDLAVLLVEQIRDELKAADPAHAAGYDSRAAEYAAKLRKLKADGLALLKDKKDRKLVAFHDSLAYFAEAFDLDIKDAIQKLAGSEPNAEEMTQVIANCKKRGVRLLAIEPQYTANNAAKSILAELRRDAALADAAVVEIDPLETVKPDDLTADWYERKLRANLEALAKAMK
jgi:ABC-type Zn uptake system ZnuABC Zn-binding protein ZnuA